MADKAVRERRETQVLLHGMGSALSKWMTGSHFYTKPEKACVQMATEVPPIGKPNHLAITGMRPDDLVKAREYYILKLVAAWRKRDSDTTEACLDWIVALVSEMRLRGSSSKDALMVRL